MTTDFNQYHLSNGANIKTSRVPGKESQKLIKHQKEMEGSIVSYPVKMPIAINKAKGAIIEDVDGNHFIDFFSCAGVVNMGHCNGEVLKAVRIQQENLIHALDFPTKNKYEIIKKILNEFPEEIRDDLKVSFCSPSGSDAVEAAIKLAKHKTGRTGVIAFHGSYHGMSAGSLAATSNIFFRQKINASKSDVHYIPYSYCYRCPFGQEKNTCQLECANYLRNILENPHSGITKPAAILLEPIQGEGGSIVTNSGYLEEIAAIAKEHDIVLIFDEIQSGFYRSGKFLASQHTKAVADIYTLSKGLGGVGFPVSAIVYNRNIESWGPGFHVGTFRGNQVSLAAGNAAFDFAEKHGVANHVHKMGAYILSRLTEMAESNPFIGEVRGEGLMIGIEYVKDKESKKPYPEITKKIRQACFQKGLMFETGGHYSNVIRFLPPLVITQEIAANALEIFVEVNEMVQKEYLLSEAVS